MQDTLAKICNRCKASFRLAENVDKATACLCTQCLLKANSSFLLTQSNTSVPPSTRRSSGRGGYKHTSQAFGVEPYQVEEQRSAFKEAGLGDIEHTPDGTPIFTSDKQMRLAGKVKFGWTGAHGYDKMGTGKSVEKSKAEMLKKYANLDVPT